MSENIKTCFTSEYKKLDRLNKSINDKESTLRMMLNMKTDIEDLAQTKSNKDEIDIVTNNQ